MKLLVINGPNMNMLGIREREIYGEESYETLCGKIKSHCLTCGIDCELFQSNHEGAVVDKIQSAYRKVDAIVINPAAYTHTSIAIPDAIKAVGIPCVEVHISDTESREDFRKINYIRPVCIATVSGKGTDGYIEAIDTARKYLDEV